MSHLLPRVPFSSGTAVRTFAAAALMLAVTANSALAQRIANHTPAQSQAIGAPEISPALIVSGVALLVGGLLIVLGRRHAARA